MFYEKRLIVSSKKFNNPEFAKEYALKHSRMSIKYADKMIDILLLKNFESGRILDTGCGSGLTLIQIAKNFPYSECYGIDLSDTLLETAKETSLKEKLTERIKFLKADVQNIPFSADYFDVVLNINMLHLVKKPVAMLNEIERVLKPDGFFFITDLKRSILGLLEREIKSAYTPEEVKDIIAQSKIQLGQFSTNIIGWDYQNL